MSEQKVKPKWMIIFMFMGAALYLINFVDAMIAKEGATFDFIGFEIGKWTYTFLALFFCCSLMSTGIKWYKQKRNSSNDS